MVCKSQSSDDSEFLDLLEGNSSGHTQQVLNLNSSIKDLECSGVVDADCDNVSTQLAFN